MEEITGVLEVSKYLQETANWIHKQIQKENFPLPVKQIQIGKRTVKTWSKKDLDNYKENKPKPGRKPKQSSQNLSWPDFG